MLLFNIMLLTLSASLSTAEGVIAVFSSELAPYRQAFGGFQEVLAERKISAPVIEHVLAREGADNVARELVREKPALVFAIGPDAAKFAKERVRNVPVVFSMVLHADPFVGRNITGVSMEIPAATKLEKISRILPGAERVGVFYSEASAPLFREIEQAGKALGFRAVGKEVTSGKDLPEAFKELAPRIDMVFMVPDTRIYFPKSIEFLLVESLKKNLPVIGLAESYTRAGALISFEADYEIIGRQAGEMAVRILGGDAPQNVEPPRLRRIKTSVNHIVAERMRIKLSPQALKELAQ